MVPGRIRTFQVLSLATIALFLSGCRSPEPSQIDCFYNQANSPFDGSSEQSAEVQQASHESAIAPTPHPAESPSEGATAAPSAGNATSEPLRLPPDIPGADAPPLRVPPRKPGETEEERHAQLQGLYPPLPAVPVEQALQPHAEDTGLTLSSLQQMAMDQNPGIRVAAASVEAARGVMIQAGLYPNPSLGFEADNVNTLDTQGYKGGYLSQTFVTAGKRRLASRAEGMNFQRAQWELRRTRVGVATAVRSAYFAALVARERLRLAQSLETFTDQIYQAQIGLTEAGEAAPYEPLQLRVFALQARAAKYQAEQDYLQSLRQLAAAIGIPELPSNTLAGSADMAVPQLQYDRVLEWVLNNHTDLAMAECDVQRADYLLQLARVTPIPDVDVNLVLQHDYTFPEGATTYNLQLGGAVPVFDRNRGNIIAAQAEVYRSRQAVLQTRNRLTAELAAAFARYQSSRTLAETFRAEALKNQVQAYRGVYDRYRHANGDVSFNDVITAQQMMATTLTQYFTVLNDQWQSVVTLAELLQTDDLLAMGELLAIPALPLRDEASAEEVPPPASP
jgi:cobalt-zinc-cadmium efflux system outer membrane protein